MLDAYKHFSLFSFSSPHSDKNVLLDYAEINQWDDVKLMLDRFPELRDGYTMNALQNRALKYLCTESLDWYRIQQLVKIFPEIIQNNVSLLLQKAWTQRLFGVYRELSKIRNQAFKYVFPPLSDRNKEMFIAAESADWGTFSYYYEIGNETLRDEDGLSLADYAHFHNSSEIFDSIKTQRMHCYLGPKPQPIIHSHSHSHGRDNKRYQAKQSHSNASRTKERPKCEHRFKPKIWS